MRKIQRQEEMRKVREEIERQQEEDYRNKEAENGKITLKYTKRTQNVDLKNYRSM